MVELPRQINPDQAAAIESIAGAAENASQLVALGNGVLNVVLGTSLKFLWSMLNTLQFIVFFTEWNVQVPANAEIAIKTFRSIALGEFIPFHWLTDPIKEAMKSSEDEDEKANVFSNMGVMLLIGLVLLLIILPVFLAAKFCGSKLKGYIEKFKKKLMWNSVLRFVLQSYLKNTIACLFAISLMKFENGGSSTNAVLSIVILVVLAIIPILAMVLLYKKRNELASDETRGRIGSLYLGIRTDSMHEYAYSAVFMLRRLIYAILTVACL